MLPSYKSSLYIVSAPDAMGNSDYNTTFLVQDLNQPLWAAYTKNWHILW